MSEPAPAIGDTVRDTVRGRVGVVMDHLGTYLQLRPVHGGCEWDARPEYVQPIAQADLLGERVAQANARSNPGGSR
ncbi:hypothetical protein ACFWZ2_22970 [Streptomyces sp. NPDC059002]|uniref:hypothetical protein n=1 Tax=Streptomyces sp. NPDC059002 TaxID=3346690 RepID=UPI0036A8873A